MMMKNGEKKMTWKFKTTEKSKALKDIRINNHSRYAKICKVLKDEIKQDCVPVHYEEKVINPEDMVINFDNKMKIQDALLSLSPRQIKVLKMRFGIGMSSEHTLEEVGRQFDVTRERIKQIELRALEKLREIHPELISLHDQFAA
jgi:RNA polymerase sigma factor (sigma-70 family)